MDVATDSGADGRWVCEFEQCEKTFARREHLKRHQRAHASADASYMCKVCFQKFNRRDSLLRHLHRHGDQFKPRPSGRSKKACRICQQGKIRCDGSQPCSRCSLKGVECVYNQVDGPPQISHAEGILHDGQAPNYLERTNHESSPTVEANTLLKTSQLSQEQPSVPARLDAPLQQRAGDTIYNYSQVAPVLAPPPAGRINHQSGMIVNWSLLRIQPDGGQSNERLPLQTQSDFKADCMAPQIHGAGTEEKYRAIYFTHFHHRWPAIHHTSFDSRPDKLVLTLSTNMVGAWIDGSEESKKYALAMHRYLMPSMFLELTNKSSRDVFQDGLSAGICISAILNIIFAFYSGDEGLVSKAVILQNILVAVLRERNFFKSEMVMADDRPGYFMPLHILLQGERQRQVTLRILQTETLVLMDRRVATHLFKMDSYLSLTRNYPALLTLEELHFALPSTFTSWNAESLADWELRQLIEPVYRSETSMSTFINEITSDSSSYINEPVLIEDVHLSMSALPDCIRRFWEDARAHSPVKKAAEVTRETIKKKLDKLKSRLNLISAPDPTAKLFGRNRFPLQYYYGYEDNLGPELQKSASERPKTLVFDTLMLFHLLNLNLYSDIRTITQIARDRVPANPPALSEYHKRAQEQRIDSTRGWATTAAARRALYHAVNILFLHQNLAHIQDAHDRARDPISYVALSTSALVIWAFCFYSFPKNFVCTYPLAPAYEGPPNQVIDISKLCRESQREAQIEFWIEAGRGWSIQMDELKLCPRNVEMLVGLFRGFIPADWELATAIAPGIL